jgi:hypothetical protein
VSEGDILKKFERHIAIIGHIQIAAVPSRTEPDEGEIAYDRVLRAIEHLGYKGWVGCEYKPRADTFAGQSWIKAMGRLDVGRIDATIRAQDAKAGEEPLFGMWPTGEHGDDQPFGARPDLAGPMAEPIRRPLGVAPV